MDHKPSKVQNRRWKWTIIRQIERSWVKADDYEPKWPVYVQIDGSSSKCTVFGHNGRRKRLKVDVPGFTSTVVESKSRRSKMQKFSHFWTVHFDSFDPFTLVLFDRPYFWPVESSTFSRMTVFLDLCVNWPCPIILAQDRPISPIATVHSDAFEPSTLELIAL